MSNEPAMTPSLSADSTTSVRWSRILPLCIALFLIFTPFEADGSLTASYVVTAVCLVLLAVIEPFEGFSAFRMPGSALLFPAMMVVHAILITPQLSAFPLLLALSVVVAMLLVGYATERPTDFIMAVRILLLINLGGLLFQYAAYVTGGEVIDIHNMLFPSSLARIETEGDGIIRLTGIQTEPGNYSTWITLLILAVRMVHGRFGIIEYLATGSIAMTFSATGIVFIGLLVIWMVADAMAGKNVKAWLTLGAFLALVLFAVFALDLIEHYQDRFVGRSDGSVLFREMALDAYSRLSISERILGFGFPNEICDKCHFADLGLGPNLFMRGGLLVVLGAIPWLWHSLKSRSLIAILSVITSVYVAKTPSFSIAAWFTLLLLSGITAKQLELPHIRGAGERA